MGNKKKIFYEKGNFVTTPNVRTLIGQGPIVTSIYFWICHFTDESGLCFPSRAKLAEYSGLSVKSVDRAISELIKLGLLEKTRRKDGAGDYGSNIYQLVIIEGGSDSQTLPSDSQTPGVATHRRQGSDSNDILTISNELNPLLTKIATEPVAGIMSHISEEEARTDPKQIAELIDCFKPINPMINFGHKTHRKAASDLIEALGYEKALTAAQFATKVQGMPYSPVITTPSQLKTKLGELRAFVAKEQARGKQFTIITI